MSSGFEYPKGPYIGLPSYAHPIIGECPIIWLNSPLAVVVNVFSKLEATFWEYPKTLNFNESTLFWRNESPNLFELFKTKLLTLAVNPPFEPLANALTSVSVELYPIPVLVTIASITLPSWRTGLTTAPAPAPVEITLNSGLELYSLPLFTTTTSTTLPSIIIGLNSALTPFFIDILGITCLSNVVEP